MHEDRGDSCDTAKYIEGAEAYRAALQKPSHEKPAFLVPRCATDGVVRNAQHAQHAAAARCFLVGCCVTFELL